MNIERSWLCENMGLEQLQKMIYRIEAGEKLYRYYKGVIAVNKCHGGYYDIPIFVNPKIKDDTGFFFDENNNVVCTHMLKEGKIFLLNTLELEKVQMDSMLALMRKSE